MRTKIPPSLKWLVNRRSRLASEIQSSKKEIQAAALEVSALEGKLAALMGDLAAIDRVLSMHEIRIHPETIVPKGTHKAEKLFNRGHVTRSLMSYLRKANGEWRSTTELMIYVSASGGVEITPESCPVLRLIVRRQLKGLRTSGRVIRKHAAKTGTEGYWALPLDSIRGSKP